MNSPEQSACMAFKLKYCSIWIWACSSFLSQHPYFGNVWVIFSGVSLVFLQFQQFQAFKACGESEPWGGKRTGFLFRSQSYQDIWTWIGASGRDQSRNPVSTNHFIHRVGEGSCNSHQVCADSTCFFKFWAFFWPDFRRQVFWSPVQKKSAAKIRQTWTFPLWSAGSYWRHHDRYSLDHHRIHWSLESTRLCEVASTVIVRCLLKHAGIRFDAVELIRAWKSRLVVGVFNYFPIGVLYLSRFPPNFISPLDLELMLLITPVAWFLQGWALFTIVKNF